MTALRTEWRAEWMRLPWVGTAQRADLGAPLGRARLSEPAALWWTDGSESRPCLHSRVPAIGFGCRVQMFGLGKVTGVK